MIINSYQLTRLVCKAYAINCRYADQPHGTSSMRLVNKSAGQLENVKYSPLIGLSKL